METMQQAYPQVAVARGDTREAGMRNALSLVREPILAKVRGRILIKPNFLSSTNALASTQAGAVRPVLELLRDGGVDMENVVIAEGGSRSTRQAFDNFGYRELADEFGVELCDLNRDRFDRSFCIFTETRGMSNIRYAERAATADTIISVAVAKTHDAAVATYSCKNMMGCLKRVQRPRMHGIRLGRTAEAGADLLWNLIEDYHELIKAISKVVFRVVRIQRSLEKRLHHGTSPGLQSQCRAIAENLARLAGVLLPDVAVIDGFEAMEGQGPGAGTPVPMGIAVAGTNAVASDAAMAWLMGFDPLSIGYLALMHEQGTGCADMSRIELLGENPAAYRRTCIPHENYPFQMNWRKAWED